MAAYDASLNEVRRVFLENRKYKPLGEVVEIF
jgi:hypothetical protein